MWRDELQKIAEEKIQYDEKINDGASAEEIRKFLEEVKSELKAELPEDYERFLEVINGLEYNGFILYGIDEHLLNIQPNQHINGLIDNNEVWHENEWDKQYIFLGESSMSWYVYDVAECTYCELDNPSGDEIETFDTLEHMLENILSDALA